jgi:hypothetical protein
MAEAVREIATTVVRGCYCCHAGCGVPIYMDQQRNHDLRQSKQLFYCINGHSQAFIGENEAEKLKRYLDNANQQLEWTRQERDRAKESAARSTRVARAYKGKVTQMKNRAANGVCPCCHRYFEALHRHMTTKHPDYKDQDI